MPEPALEPRHPLTGVTVLAVFAHPDDESIACGGTLAGLAAGGARIVLLCGSRGERGGQTESACHSLGDTRTDELKAAASALGVEDLLVLDHPDGNLRWSDVGTFHADITMAIGHCRPTAVITFGDDGLYWHPDHIGVHERTTNAVQSLGAGAPALYYVTMPPGTIRQIANDALARGWKPPNHGFWSLSPDAFGSHAGPATLTINVESWIDAKLSALACHKTQFGANDPIATLTRAKARQWLGVEHFHRPVWSDSKARVLECLTGGIGNGEPSAMLR